MLGLGLLKDAIGRLTGSLNGLAVTVEQMNANARERLSLDVGAGPQTLPPPETPGEAGNGRAKARK
jgi:hypothetical protein